MSKISSRERVKIALNHQEPDRIPLGLGGSANKLADITYMRLKERLGLNGTNRRVVTGLTETYLDDELINALDIDVRYIHLRRPRSFQIRYSSDGSFINEWGLSIRYLEHFIEIGNPPFQGLSEEAIETYTWPDPYDPGRIDGLSEEVNYLYFNTDRALAAYRPVPAGIFEMACFLRGTENLLIDMIQDPDNVSLLFEKILGVYLGLYDVQLKVVGKYVQIVEIIDDLGTQQSLLVSPDLYRRLIKPHHAEWVKFIKERAPEVKVMIHSCGAVSQLVGDFIDIGIDILNPVQPLASGMDTRKLKADFGKNICFLGGIDVQQALRGTREEVISEVEKRIADLAPGGGYIFAPSHNLGADIPVDNIVTMYDTARHKGIYPIDI